MNGEMDIRINGSSQPKYVQIAEQLKSQILSGRLPAGRRLPTMRALAGELRVAVLTVHHAYEALREDGLVNTRVGSGTYVAESQHRTTNTMHLGNVIDDGPMNNFETVSQAIGLRSMASSVPDPDLFFADELLADMRSGGLSDPWNCYYAPAAGHPDLIREIVALLQSDEIESSDNRTLVTMGSSHGLFLILQALTSPGDTVLIESPSRLKLLETCSMLGIRTVPLLAHESGFDLAEVETLIVRHAPKLIYVAPTFGATTGQVQPLSNRLGLLELAERYSVFVIEDAAYNAISFVPNLPLPLAALTRSQNVIHVGSFSYMLNPTLRTGFIHAPKELRNLLVQRSQLTVGSGVNFLQVALARFLGRGQLKAHLKRVLPKYRSRRDALLSALSVAMPKGTTWTTPSGGFSTWVTLPLDDASLFARSLEKGVAFAPGELFLEDSRGVKMFRLSYGVLSPEPIREAVTILSTLVHEGIRV